MADRTNHCADCVALLKETDSLRATITQLTDERDRFAKALREIVGNTTYANDPGGSLLPQMMAVNRLARAAITTPPTPTKGDDHGGD